MPSATDPLEALITGTPGTMDLILYRLARIEQQTVGLVRHDTYSLESEHLKARVSSLEGERQRSTAQTRTLWAGIGLALLVPVLGNLDKLSQLFGG